MRLSIINKQLKPLFKNNTAQYTELYFSIYIFIDKAHCLLEIL